MRKEDRPAFPLLAKPPSEGEEFEPYSQYVGISMRDYFAAKAMQSWLLNHEEVNYWFSDYSEAEAMVFIAERSYMLADAMLKQREK